MSISSRAQDGDGQSVRHLEADLPGRSVCGGASRRKSVGAFFMAFRNVLVDGNAASLKAAL